MAARRGGSIRSNGAIASPWSAALAAAVRGRRKALGLTQLELSRLAGCGPVFVYDLEVGKATLRLNKLVEVLVVLGLELKLEPGKRGLVIDERLS